MTSKTTKWGRRLIFVSAALVLSHHQVGSGEGPGVGSGIRGSTQTQTSGRSVERRKIRCGFYQLKFVENTLLLACRNEIKPEYMEPCETIGMRSDPETFFTEGSAEAIRAARPQSGRPEPITYLVLARGGLTGINDCRSRARLDPVVGLCTDGVVRGPSAPRRFTSFTRTPAIPRVSRPQRITTGVTAQGVQPRVGGGTEPPAAAMRGGLQRIALADIVALEPCDRMGGAPQRGCFGGAVAERSPSVPGSGSQDAFLEAFGAKTPGAGAMADEGEAPLEIIYSDTDGYIPWGEENREGGLPESTRGAMAFWLYENGDYTYVAERYYNEWGERCTSGCMYESSGNLYDREQREEERTIAERARQADPRRYQMPACSAAASDGCDGEWTASVRVDVPPPRPSIALTPPGARSTDCWDPTGETCGGMSGAGTGTAPGISRGMTSRGPGYGLIDPAGPDDMGGLGGGGGGGADDPCFRPYVLRIPGKYWTDDCQAGVSCDTPEGFTELSRRLSQTIPARSIAPGRAISPTLTP